MKHIELTTNSGAKVTIFFNTNSIAVLGGTDGKVCVMDGLHNNGGWTVKETYQEVINKILAA